MRDRGGGRTSLERIELLEKESGLRKSINDLRYKRQNLISEIKQKRENASSMKKKRDDLNKEVKELVEKGKEHIKKRNELQDQVRKLKDKRSGISRSIKPQADKIRSEKQQRWQLNRAARTSAGDITAEFNAALKTLFEMELALRDEVIMVEMIMDIQRRFKARKEADIVNKDIKKTWKQIKSKEEAATEVSTEIMALAAEGEQEHQTAMELFDKKDELGDESHEAHAAFVALVKEIRSMSRKIDDLSKEIDSSIKDIRPLQKNLDRVRLTRREEQRIEQLQAVKTKMDTSGKIDLYDLRVLMESKAFDLAGKKDAPNVTGSKDDRGPQKTKRKGEVSVKKDRDVDQNADRKSVRKGTLKKNK